MLNSEQRNRYKHEFTSEYSEYMKLFEYVDDITQRFVSLADKLRAEKQGSKAYLVNKLPAVRN